MKNLAGVQASLRVTSSPILTKASPVSEHCWNEQLFPKGTDFVHMDPNADLRTRTSIQAQAIAETGLLLCGIGQACSLVRTGISAAKTFWTAKTLVPAINIIEKGVHLTNVAEKATTTGITLTPKRLREYLSNVGSYSKEKIIADAKACGLNIKPGCEKGTKGHLDLINKRGKIRLKIHPADRNTPYDHLHIYNNKFNSLDIYLNEVHYTSTAAHIPYGISQ
jgi:hypothetical protein